MKDSNKVEIKSDMESSRSRRKVGYECKVENNIRFYSEYAKHIYLVPSPAAPAKPLEMFPPPTQVIFLVS